MKIRLYLIAVCIVLMAIIISCVQKGKTTTTSSNETVPSYITYSENGKYGAKNNNDSIIVPAEYDSIVVSNQIIIAQKADETFIFDGAKQVFNCGMHFYSIEDKYITAIRGERCFLYFYKTGLSVEDMYIYYYDDNTFLCQFPDESYAFYSDDGTIKAQGLQRISCLQKIKNGNITKRYLAFRKKDAGRLIYTISGDLLYDIDLPIWQNIAITYMELYDGDDREYEWTYNYKIDLDRCIQDHLRGEILLKYPEE